MFRRSGTAGAALPPKRSEESDESVTCIDLLPLHHDPTGAEPVAAAPADQHDDDTRGSNAKLRVAAFDGVAVAQVVLNRDGVLELANDLARRTFGLGAGDLDRPIRDLALFSFPVALAEHLHRAVESRPVDVRAVRWDTRSGERILDVRITPLTRENTAIGTSITYTDVTARHRLRQHHADAERRIAQAHAQSRSTAEQLEVKLEELRSLSALLDAANDDLVAADEGLVRLSDEARSADHERTLLRDELDRRGEELIHVKAPITTIVDAVDLPVIILDHEREVRISNRRLARYGD